MTSFGRKLRRWVERAFVLSIFAAFIIDGVSLVKALQSDTPDFALTSGPEFDYILYYGPIFHQSQLLILSLGILVATFLLKCCTFTRQTAVAFTAYALLSLVYYITAFEYQFYLLLSGSIILTWFFSAALSLVGKKQCSNHGT